MLDALMVVIILFAGAVSLVRILADNPRAARAVGWFGCIATVAYVISAVFPQTPSVHPAKIGVLVLITFLGFLAPESGELGEPDGGHQEGSR